MFFVIKPGKGKEAVRRKHRLVARGNCLPQAAMTSTPNDDIAATRAMISWNFTKGLRCGSLDVKTAFLNAELKGWSKAVIAPPSALVRMGLMKATGYWIVSPEGLVWFQGVLQSMGGTQRQGHEGNTVSAGGKQTWLSQSVTHSSTWLILK